MRGSKKIVLAGVLALSTFASAGSASAASYTVKGSDTMWKIAARYGVTLNTLISANPQVANPNNIRTGMVINIPAAQQSTGTQSTASTFSQQIVTLVNQEREKAGLKPLLSNNSLSVMALDKAKEMYNSNYFSHTSPTYGSPFQMMNAYGIRYTYAGENIAKGQRTPQEVMNAWMNSTGHRRNILSPNFTHIGVGYYNGVWVQEFIAN
ncbi:LysM peptidoglycan-binding domain-containing protein [Paenibacillus antri]|uniref:LysM peptidoglycan-binding domain-containing protein n=1 Tax=Paenibacillus antri TaxID=2582848 RepID=A0A5R9G155_9BACL|nr:CAP domain-containing protein [Paenibacillus antri]TLS50067.1 LysM peptidoglycan-binding domain-containing protein [Paenibacillus antri]